MSASFKVIKNKFPDAVKAASDEDLEEAAKAGGFVVQREAKLNVNRIFSKFATGASGLQGSIIVKVAEKKPQYVEVDIGPTKIYGRIQELGGTIRPLFAKALSWIDRDTQERRFAKSVTLPARPYLRPAMDEHKNDVFGAITEMLKAAIVKAIK